MPNVADDERGDTLETSGRFAIVPMWVIRRCGKDTTALAVYAYMAARAGGGEAFPHQATVADEMSLSLNTVHRAIQRLEALALLRIEPRLRTGRKVGNRYLLNNSEPQHGNTSRGVSSKHRQRCFQ